MNTEPMPEIVQGDARHLDLPDESVDLVVTSPPYFGLRDYGTPGQLGAEPTPAEYIAALIECTAEMVRVLKPSGSIFVNLGDKYGGSGGGPVGGKTLTGKGVRSGTPNTSHIGRPKSLQLLPERYRIAAVDELGLIARAVLIWSKPNGLPESVTDRVRRSHEDWVHLTKSPKYFAAVDEIREPPQGRVLQRGPSAGLRDGTANPAHPPHTFSSMGHPLGKLPSSVWSIATQPLKVPAELGVDHFAAFPMEWPRRLILGWSPREVCTVCGEGRRPVTAKITGLDLDGRQRPARDNAATWSETACADNSWGGDRSFARGVGAVITGYACACTAPTVPVTIREFDYELDEMIERVVERPDPEWRNPAPTTPGVVLDPFGGTGTTAIVAAMNGRRGISVDLSPDYCRLAAWRAQDPKQRAKAS